MADIASWLVSSRHYANVIHISSMKFASETNLTRTRIRKILVLCMAAELSSLAAGVTSYTEADSATFLLLLLLLSGIAHTHRETKGGREREREGDTPHIQRLDADTATKIHLAR